MSIQVDDEVGDTQLHRQASALSVPKCCEGEEYSPTLPQMSLNEEPGDDCNGAMRGGYGESSSARHQRFFGDAYSNLAQDFDWLYSRLLHNTLAASGTAPPSACTKAWVSLAGILQLRSAYLERQVEDLKWHVDVLGAVESDLQGIKDECGATMLELNELKRIMARDKERMRKIYSGRRQEREATSKPKRNPGKGKEIAVDTAREDVKDLSTTLFYFYPASSTIVVPGLPARILTFPRGTNLPGIHDFLIYEYENKKECDAFVTIVRKIMDARAKMGLQLPESLLDEVVVISVPDEIEGEAEADESINIAAWRTLVGDDGYVQFLDRDLPFRPKPTLEIDKEGHDRVEPATDNPELSAFLSSPGFSDDDAAAELSDSICSCTLCAAEHDPCVLANPYRRPVVSVRGGADDYEDDYDDYINNEYLDDYGDYDDDDWAWVEARAEFGYDSDDESVVHEDEAEDPWDDGW